MRNVIISIFVSLLLMACGHAAAEPTIDGTTTESLQSSVEEVANSLQGEEQKRFKMAFSSLTWHYTAAAAADPEKLRGDSQEEVMAWFNSQFHGKTSSEVVDMFNQLQKEGKLNQFKGVFPQ